MNTLQKVGLAVFSVALLIFTLMLGLGKHAIDSDHITIDNTYHKTAIQSALEKNQLLGSLLPNISAVSHIKTAIIDAQSAQNALPIPDGVNEWDFKIGDWKIKEYLSSIVKSTAKGPVQQHPLLFLFLTFGLAIIGGLLYIVPKFAQAPGIKHDGIYHQSLTRGLRWNVRTIFLAVVSIAILGYGITYMGGQFFWSIATIIVAGLITYLVFYREKSKNNAPQRSASPLRTGWLGVIAGIYLIGFYVLLYWFPPYINNWVTMVNPVSKLLSGNDASQWFLYGLMYTVIVIVMGIRMLSKYQHNRYQRIRTYSVMFFQTAFAFLIPEIMVRFNQPWFDFKNIWPLNYTFFFDWNINTLINNGGLGLFMLVWGIALIVIAVPVITYFFGKRWYCSWVCGCGGLAETMGDPFRQLSDKSLRAWKYERYIIHGVLLFAILMTAMVLYTYFTGQRNILFLSSDTVRTWYGFLIGSAFAGVVGTGFYPLMGNRVWCRFGCPLAAYLGLVQRFKSRFRITTNGGQCISCGNCSTYCEMGIDVRAYAQRGQNIVRSSCVGCGVCAAVCPRGVLKLENGPNTDSSRTALLKTIHIGDNQIRIDGL